MHACKIQIIYCDVWCILKTRRNDKNSKNELISFACSLRCIHGFLTNIIYILVIGRQILRNTVKNP